MTSSHALRVVHAGSLGFGGFCSCPDGCNWETQTWRATEESVVIEHDEHKRGEQ